MAYPNTSDFTAAQDDAAWWQVSTTLPDGSTALVVCSTNGRAFIDWLQSQLNVTVDGRWGPGTSAALVSALQGKNADPALISGVQAETQLQRVGPLSLRGAIWLVHSAAVYGDAPQGLTIMQINVPDGTAMPAWSTASSLGPGGDILPTCSTVSSSPQGSPPPAPAPPAPTITLTPLGPAPEMTSSVPLGLIVAVVAGVGLIAAITWNVSNKPSPTTRARRVRTSVRAR